MVKFWQVPDIDIFEGLPSKNGYALNLGNMAIYISYRKVYIKNYKRNIHIDFLGKKILFVILPRLKHIFFFWQCWQELKHILFYYP
jgi:hypothetical protein